MSRIIDEITAVSTNDFFVEDLNCFLNYEEFQKNIHLDDDADAHCSGIVRSD